MHGANIDFQTGADYLKAYAKNGNELLTFQPIICVAIVVCVGVCVRIKFCVVKEYILTNETNKISYENFSAPPLKK